MTKEIKLHGKYGEGKFALVDDEDYEWIMQWDWYVTVAGYVVRNKRAKTFYLHREIACPNKYKEIDHVNRNKLDNRKSNLRECSSSQNKMNRPSKGRFDVKGIHWDSKRGKYSARLFYKGKNLFLGRYSTKRDAAQAYNQAAKKYYGEFAYLNNLE